jgi:hypothetical protein
MGSGAQLLLSTSIDLPPTPTPSTSSDTSLTSATIIIIGCAQKHTQSSEHQFNAATIGRVVIVIVSIHDNRRRRNSIFDEQRASIEVWSMR